MALASERENYDKTDFVEHHFPTGRANSHPKLEKSAWWLLCIYRCAPTAKAYMIDSGDFVVWNGARTLKADQPSLATPRSTKTPYHEAHSQRAYTSMHCTLPHMTALQDVIVLLSAFDPLDGIDSDAADGAREALQD